MKNSLLCFGAALVMAAFPLCSFAASGAESDSMNRQTIDSTMAPAQADANRGADKFSPSDSTTSIPWGLILAGLALVGAGVAYFLCKTKIDSQDRLFDRRMEQRKMEISRLENQLANLEKSIPDKVQAVLQAQLAARLAEEEQKARQAREEAVAREMEDRMRREAEEEAASRPFPSKVYFASYKESVNGFAVEYLSEERKANSTVVITTLSAEEAEFSLVSDMNPTAFRSIINACEVMEGSPESYSSIRVDSPGSLSLDEDVWIVKDKVKISCL